MIVWIEPVPDDDAEASAAYWRAVDENPEALVLVSVRHDSDDEDGGEFWHPVVFSTRAKAEAFMEDEEIADAVVSVVVIDDPGYGCEPEEHRDA